MKCGVNNNNDWFFMIENMGSQGGGSSDNNGKNSEFQPLMRQPSLYNLTLDEVQNHLGDLGKPLTSMNLDELLKNVWTVEANQSAGMDNNEHIGTAQAGQAALQHQASLSLTGAMSKKTVDEVWRDIQESKDNEKKSQERQQTLGEMTLEDFLVKAGIVTESSKKKEPVTEAKVDVDSSLAAPAPAPAPAPQFAPWIQFPPQPHFPHPQQNLMGIYMPAGQNLAHAQPMHMGAGAPLDVPFADGQVAVAGPVNVMGNMPDGRRGARKRGMPEDMVERTVERRQKRMIKNRESAARSRARKQVSFLFVFSDMLSKFLFFIYEAPT